MSKISEQKALEVYPIAYYRNGGGIDDANASDRAVYEEGYDQALQDFLEKAEEFFYDRFNIHPHDCHVVQYVSDTPLVDIDGFIEQIKNYMKNESEN